MPVRTLSFLTAALLLSVPQETEVSLASVPLEGVETFGHAIIRIELVEDDATFTVDGSNGTDHDKRLTMLHVEDVEWTDTVRAVDGGRVSALTRRFGDIAGGISFEVVGESFDEREGTSPLAGRTVVFDRDTGDATHERGFDDEHAVDDAVDEKLLAGLAVAVDLAGMLPDEPVAVGDRWTVDAPGFGAALLPLGDLDMDVERQRLIALGTYTGFTAPALPPVPAWWWGAPASDVLRGEVELTLARVDERDGRRLAHLDVTADLTAKADLAPWLREYVIEHFDPEIHELEVRSTMKGTGVLVWDVDGARPVSWDLEAELDVDLDAAWALHENRVYELDSSRRLTGTLRSTIEFTTKR